MTGKKKKSYLTPNEVADILMLSVESVRQLAEKGELQALMTPGGHRRYQATDVKEFAAKRGLMLAHIDSGPIRILIVDDNEALCGFLASFFETLDQDIVTDCAHDGFEAGRKVHVFKPDFVLLDLQMPGMDGFQVCQKLKTDPSTSGIRIVAITGFPREENIEKILAAGAEVCLKKPIDTKQLLSHLGLSKSAVQKQIEVSE